MHILLGETFNITDCMHSACGPNGAQTLPEYHCSLDMKSRYSFCQGRGNHEPGCRQHNSETRNSSWEVKHAQKSGRCWFCISLKINGCSSLCHDSSQQSCHFFFLEKHFKLINAPMPNVRGTWQHQRPVLHCTGDATL